MALTQRRRWRQRYHLVHCSDSTTTRMLNNISKISVHVTCPSKQCCLRCIYWLLLKTVSDQTALPARRRTQQLPISYSSQVHCSGVWVHHYNGPLCNRCETCDLFQKCSITAMSWLCARFPTVSVTQWRHPLQFSKTTTVPSEFWVITSDSAIVVAAGCSSKIHKKSK